MLNRRHFLIASSSTWLLACSPQTKKEIDMSSPIPFKLGQSGEVFMRGIPESIASVDRPVPSHPQVAYYDLDWIKHKTGLGTMRFEHGEHGFVLENIYRFTGAGDFTPNEGFNRFSLNFSITNQDAETHAIARDGIYAFMKKLQAAGWRKYIHPADPRLKGTHTLGYRFNYDSTYPLDPNYVPVMKQWIDGAGEYPLKKHETSVWEFWANGVYMTIGFSRGYPKFGQSGMPAEHEPAAYLFSMNLRSETAYLRHGVDLKPGENLFDRWKEELIYSRKRRAEIEAKMRAAQKPGKMWDWDTDYKDPPILALAQQ